MMRRFQPRDRGRGKKAKWYLLGCSILVAVPLVLLGSLMLDSKDIPWRTFTVEAGSYTGRVTDAATGLPIEGAAVYLDCSTWRSHNILEAFGGIEAGTENYYMGESLTFSDAQGYYRAPDATISRRLSLRAEPPLVEMLVYKKGYVGFNSEFDFDGENKKSKDSTLKKGVNPVSLRPWPENYPAEAWSHHFYFMDVLQYTAAGEKYRAFRDILHDGYVEYKLKK